MTATIMGRPSLEGDSFTNTTCRLDKELAPIVYSGAACQAELLAFSHPKRRKPQPSNANWFRSLIEHAFERAGAIPTATLLPAIQKAVMPITDYVLISMKLPEEHRIMLRKLECQIQQHDWTVDFTRNAVLNLLVLVEGQAFNAGLKAAVEKRRAK